MRKLLLCGLVVASMLSLPLLESAGLFAQEGESAAKTERRGPLPFFYGKLGVSDEQREHLYDIQDDYEERLKTLREEMKRVLRERDQQMEAALSPGQKLRLQELRAAAKKSESKKPVVKKQVEETVNETVDSN